MTAEGRRELRLWSVMFSLIALAGCTRLPPGSQPPAGASGVAETTSIEAIVQPLRKSSDLATCRTVLQQVNAHLAAVPAAKTQRLDETEAAALRHRFGLADEEFNEIASGSFTLLDPYHVEQCFALSDAARSLEVDDASAEVRARTAFAWVMRQVQMWEGDEEPIPPLATLRRGWGTGTQRGLVFLSLLEQFDVPGCMIVLPGARQTWLVGALTEKQMILFDPRLGWALPGPGGRGIASFSQLREQTDDLFKSLAGLNYDVPPNLARTAMPQLVCSLSALAPRTRLLEQSLETGCRVRLSCDARGIHRALKEAMAGPEPDGRTMWITPGTGDPSAPVRVLRSFLPREQGGSDETRWRHRQWELTLTPWSALPASIRQVPENIEPGVRLRNAFEQPFLELVQTSGQPRDLLIRGRLADCVTRLVEVREGIDRHLTGLRAEPELDKELAAWCVEAERLHGDLLLARRQAAAKAPANPAAVEQAERQVAAHWDKWDRIRQAVFSAAAVPLIREIDYFLALAKHEQAERAQSRLERSADKPAELTTAARDTWQAAAERWQRYLDSPMPSWPTVGALLNRARAMEMLGQRDAALAMLESAVGDQRGWNEKALRYAIQQLKAR